MRSAYAVDDLPVRGAGAFMPAPPGVVVKAEVSSWGLVHVSGAPGTLPVPAPRNPIAQVCNPVDYAPETQTTNVVPDAWLPAIYVPSMRNMGPQQGCLGIRVRHHEDMPIPATNIQRYALPAFRPATKLGGRRVTPNPRAFQRWPSVSQPNPWGRALW